MTYLYIHNYRLNLGIAISISVHILAIAWLFSTQNNTIYMDSGLRFSERSSISVSLKKKPKSIQKTVIAEKIQENPEEVIEQIPVVENASFEGIRTPPTYPKRALRMRQEGVVLLKALVNARGTIQNIEIVQSSGFNALDKSAINAVWSWKFRPTYKDGKPIVSWIKIPVEFTIK